MAKFIIEQFTGHQYEPIAEGEFDSQEAAVNGMKELESECGWRDMRVVKDDGPRYNLSGSMLTGDDANEVVEYGLESE